MPNDGPNFELHLPDRENTARLGETRLLLNATDTLLENGRHFGRPRLGVGGIVSSLNIDGGGCGILYLAERRLVSRRPTKPRSMAAEPPETISKSDESLPRDPIDFSRPSFMTQVILGGIVHGRIGASSSTHRGDPAGGRDSADGAR